MAYILVFIVFANGALDPSSSTSQSVRFSTQQSCEAAAKAMKEELPRMRQVSYVCVKE